jgi:predicted RNA-binding Zn-ribbon protein involved in translation (DUF1610 family)
MTSAPMVTDNEEAYRLEKSGRSVIVVCADCGEQVWSDKACYRPDEDEWVCPDCYAGEECGDLPPRGYVGGVTKWGNDDG